MIQVKRKPETSITCLIDFQLNFEIQQNISFHYLTSEFINKKIIKETIK